MTDQRNICYCGEYGGGVHTRSARCPGGELRTLEGEPALTQSSGLPGTREPVVTAPQGNAGESPPRLLSSKNQTPPTLGDVAQFLAEAPILIVHSRTLYELRDQLSKAVWIIQNVAPETSDERSKAAMVTRGELGALTIRLAEAEVILAQALACNDYEPQHVEWLTDAANWLNRPNYHLFVLPAHQLGPKTAPVSGAEASGGRQASSEETTASEKICRWSPIEEGSDTFQPGCCRELWDREQGRELYDYCHHCGGRIEEVPDESDSYIHGPGTFPHSDGCKCERCSPPNGKADSGKP